MAGLLILAQPLTAGTALAWSALWQALRQEGAGNRMVLGWGGAHPPSEGEVVALPAATGLRPGGRWILDADGQPVDHAWKKRRVAATLALLAEIRPDVLVIDGAAHASGAFRFELRPVMEIAARYRPRPLIAAWDGGASDGPRHCADQPEPELRIAERDTATVAARLRALLTQLPEAL